MRIWSLHPKYLDTKGLVALWRETLLAKHVLEGKTKGYTQHPQLTRFKLNDKPLDSINQYLTIVYQEALDRGYHFDKDKINWKFKTTKIPLTTGQLEYEISHLLKKIQTRDVNKYKLLREINKFEAHPLFVIIDGEIEIWEKTKGE
jgi:hypothetical protein